MIKKINKKKMAIIATVPMMIRFFLVNHINLLQKHYELTIISNLSENQELLDILPKEIKKFHVPFQRNISLFSDIKCLLILIFHFNKINYSITYSISPKGGFLSSTAAYLTGIPIRIHTFTGQVWVLRKGFIKLILKSIDKLINTFSTNLFIDSKSQKVFLIKNKIIDKGKSIVIGDGSISGVNIKRFKPNFHHKKKMRKKYNIDEETIIFLFLGRINRDKGIYSLIESFNKISQEEKKFKLWIVGKDEENLRKLFNKKRNIKFFSYTNSPEYYMQAADIFCLPSKREGFGTTVIEAAACSIPSIGSNIYGISDAIVNRKTGLLFNVQDINDLSKKMMQLACNHELRKNLGLNARNRVMKKFNEDQVSSNLVKIINNL